MIRAILKKVRQNKILNLFFRKILKQSAIIFTNLYKYLTNRWTPLGVLNCNFEGISFKYYSNCDDRLVNYFYYDIPYPEKSVLKTFIEFSKKSKTIIDIGANTGLYSIIASLTNPNSKIIAIEPYTVNAERLKVNINLNQSHNIKLLELAVGENDGEIEIAVPQNKSITDVASINRDFSKHIYPDLLWSKQIVEVKKLDSVMKEEDIDNPILIKCDVETYEMEVFKGMTNILEKQKPIIILECFLDYERNLFFNDILKKFNYHVCLIVEEGLVYSEQGFIESPSSYYIMTPVKPSKTFISHQDK
jgi:FkbM family methyltransferase